MTTYHTPLIVTVLAIISIGFILSLFGMFVYALIQDQREKRRAKQRALEELAKTTNMS